MITSYWLGGTLSPNGWTFFMELFISEMFFMITQKRKKLFPLRFIGTVLILALTFLFIPPFLSNPYPAISPIVLYTYDTFYFSFVFFVSVLAMMLSFEENFWTILFCCVAGYCAQHITYLFYDIVRLTFRLHGVFKNDFFSVFLTTVLNIPLYFLFARRIKKGDCVNIGNKNIILLGLLSVIVNIILSLWQLNGARDTVTIVIEEMYSIICCVLILILQFSVFQRLKLQKRMDLMQYMWASDKEHYELRKDSIDMINIKCHDLKHTIHHLKGEISENAVNELEKSIEVYDLVLKTGNDALDVILTEKNLYCKQHHIELTVMGDGKQLDFMDQVDIYSLFGNALDNAIRAVNEIEEEEKKAISLSMKSDKTFFSIHIMNYFTGSLVLENGLPVTTKEDKENHGFGMKSMEIISAKYGGNMTMTTDGDIFNLDIVLPRKE